MTQGIRTSMLGVGMMFAAAGAMAQAPSADAAKVARGKYLMTIGACNDCHSPKLDPQGNSVRGILACKELANQFGLHAFEMSNVGSSFMQWLL